jgi:hypothetical protein
VTQTPVYAWFAFLCRSSVRPTLHVDRLGAAVRAVSFWCAVALPFAAIAVLVVGGDPTVVLALLAGNAVALLIGHDHHAPSRPNRDD